MAFYIKVTQDVATALDLTEDRNKTADGNVLLWQADIAGVSGDTVFDRAAAVGGVCLTPQQAKAEIEGVETPAEVLTPEQYHTENSEESEEKEVKDESGE